MVPGRKKGGGARGKDGGGRVGSVELTMAYAAATSLALSVALSKPPAARTEVKNTSNSRIVSTDRAASRARDGLPKIKTSPRKVADVAPAKPLRRRRGAQAETLTAPRGTATRRAIVERSSSGRSREVPQACTR